MIQREFKWKIQIQSKLIECFYQKQQLKIWQFINLIFFQIRNQLIEQNIENTHNKQENKSNIEKIITFMDNYFLKTSSSNMKTSKSGNCIFDKKFLVKIPLSHQKNTSLQKYPLTSSSKRQQTIQRSLGISKSNKSIFFNKNSATTRNNSSLNNINLKQFSLLNTSIPLTNKLFSPRNSSLKAKLQNYKLRRQTTINDDDDQNVSFNKTKYCRLKIINKTSTKQFKLKITTTNQLKEFVLNQYSSQSQTVIGFKTVNNENILLDLFMTFSDCDISYLNGTKLSLQMIEKEESKKVNMNSFEILKCIGTGGFSKVFLCRFKEDGKYYAMKIIDKHFILKHKKTKIVMNQRNVMQMLSHPFIVDLKFAFESANSLVFVLEYCPGGQMFSLVKRFKRMSEHMAKFYMIEILLALDKIHSQGILYRDFKPENILVDLEGHIKIADFGLAKPNYFSSKDRAYSFCGSPEYMPPEMILKEGHSLSVDFYCLGAVLYELVTGLPPFYSKDTNQIYNSTVNQQISFPSKTSLSSQIKNLLKGLLQKQEHYRLGSLFGVKQVLAHPWFGKFSKQQYLKKQKKPPVNFKDISSITLDFQQLRQSNQQYVSEAKKQQQQDKRLFSEQVPNFYYDYRYSIEQLKMQHEKNKIQDVIFKKKTTKYDNMFRSTQRSSGRFSKKMKQNNINPKISLLKLMKKQNIDHENIDGNTNSTLRLLSNNF